MLQEAIYDFKKNGPLILPDLIDNACAEEMAVYDDYAIIPYSVLMPCSISDVLDMFAHRPELVMLYHYVPSDATNFGHQCCAYSNPATGQMFKLNVMTNASGLVDTLNVTVYESLELMSSDILQDLTLHQARGRFVMKRDEAEIANDFS